MYKQRIFIFYLLLTFHVCNSQHLTPLFELEGHTVGNGWISNPNYNFKINEKSEVYVNGKKIFTPDEDFKGCIFELFNHRFLVITAIDEEHQHLNYVFSFLKKKVKIIDLSTEKIYYFNLHQTDLVNIEIKNGKMEVTSIKKKIVKQESINISN